MKAEDKLYELLLDELRGRYHWHGRFFQLAETIFSMLLMMLAYCFSKGFVLYCFWGWFLVPAGCFPITFFQASGIVCMLSVIGYGRSGGNPKELDFARVLSYILNLLIMLLVGFMIKCAM